MNENQYNVAYGEESFVMSLTTKEGQEDSDSLTRYAHTDCTILKWNGEYQKPNITITKEKIRVSLGTNVTKIQLRHVPSGGIRFYTGGTHSIPNGTYVLSLHGSSYPHEFIKACVSYD